MWRDSQSNALDISLGNVAYHSLASKFEIGAPPRLKYLHFLTSTHNLLTSFNMRNISPFHLFNFLIWYEVETYTGDTCLQLKFTRDIIDLSA